MFFTLIPYGLQTVIDKPKQVCTDSSLVKEKAQQNIKKGNLGLWYVRRNQDGLYYKANTISFKCSPLLNLLCFKRKIRIRAAGVAQ